MSSPKTMRAKVFTSFFKSDLCDDVSAISPITARFPKVPATDGRNFTYMVHQPGQPLYGNITFEIIDHDESRDKIKQWVKDTYEGKEIRKDISIDIFDQAGDTVRTFNLISCFPTSFDYVDMAAGGQAGTVGKLILEVRVNRIEMA